MVLNGGNVVNYLLKSPYLGNKLYVKLIIFKLTLAKIFIVMKIVAIITIIFGVFLFVVAGCLYQALPACKDDADLVLYLLMMLCSSFAGICCVLAGILDYRRSK